jgi:hypothetical protein
MMSGSYHELISNTALLLAMSILYDLIPLRKAGLGRNWLNEILTGVSIGFIGLIVMLTPWTFTPGVFFDTRSILLSMSGLFFGLIPTTIAVVLTASLRIFQGGAGTGMGVSVILMSAGLGLGWRYILRAKMKTPSPIQIYGFGILIHAGMLLSAFLLPRNLIYAVLGNISIPVMTIYPIGTFLLGLLLVRQAERTQRQDQIELSLAMWPSL